MEKCKSCKFWIFSKTLGSGDVPIWHCRDGFSPSKDCIDIAKYNAKIRKLYYKKHPDMLQLTFHFLNSFDSNLYETQF